MISFKHKISSFLTGVRRTLESFLLFKSSRRKSQVDFDKKLVYSLSPRKIPNGRQLKYLSKFLNPRENLIIKICFLIILANLVYLGFFISNRYVKSMPAYGGVYIEGVVGYPKNINPLYAASRDVDNDLSRLIYSSLFQYDAKGRLQPDLVDTYEISEDYKEYTVKIKEGVKWHNDENLISDDVIFTLRLIQDENYRSPLRTELSGVTAEKIDDLTVKFTLSEPYAPFLEMLTFGIMPKSIWERINAEAAALTDFNLKPIGSGPYKFKTLVRSTDGDLREYNLEANEEYYLKRPFIKQISFKFFADHSEAIRSFNNGHVDGLSVLPFSFRSELMTRDSVNVLELSRPQIVSIFFNVEKNTELEKVETKRALALALDKNNILQGIYGNAFHLADGPILNNSFAYNSNLSRYDYNPAEAESLLGEVKPTIKLAAIDVNGNAAVVEGVAAYWQAVGVNVTLDIIPLEQAAEVLKTREFEAILYGQVVGGDPDISAFWHSSQAGTGLNIANYKNEEADKLLTDARGAILMEERVAKYARLQEIISEQIPAIFLYTPSYTYIQSKKIKGFDGTAVIEPADRFSQIVDWHIKTRKIISRD